jgi:hypothetical protein
MNTKWQKILLGGALAAALAACSSTGTSKDSGMGSSGSSGASGSTGSSSDVIDKSGNNSGVTPPPVTSPSSTGGVIDDRVNSHNDVPGKTQ